MGDGYDDDDNDDGDDDEQIMQYLSTKCTEYEYKRWEAPDGVGI